MNSNNKIYSIIFGILFAVFLVSGTTLAIYTWQTVSEDEDVIEGVSTCFDINYVKSNNIGSNNDIKKLSLSADYTGGLSTTMKISIDSRCVDISGVGTLYLNTEEDTSDYLIENELLNYQLLVNGVETSDGVIDTKDSIPIYSEFEVDYNVKNITVYVWVNGETVTNDNVEDVINSIYKGNITANVESR